MNSLILFAAASALMTFASLCLFWPKVRRYILRAELEAFRYEVYENAKKYNLLETSAYEHCNKKLDRLCKTDIDLTIAWFYAPPTKETTDATDAEDDMHPFMIWFYNRLMGMMVMHFLADTLTGLVIWVVVSVGVPEKFAAFKLGVAQLLKSKPNVTMKPHSFSC